ncbi:unnamed protein product [Sympodiomycopsis kandeliae]
MASSSRPREPSSRALTTLVHSTNPYTRVSRSDDPRTAKEKEEILEDLVEMAKQTLLSRSSTPPLTPEQHQQMADRIRSRLSRTSSGREQLPHFESLIDKLQRIAQASDTIDVSSMTALIYQMAFTAPQTSSSSSHPLEDSGSSRASPLLGTTERGHHHHQLGRLTSRASLASATSRVSSDVARPSSRLSSAVAPSATGRRSDFAAGSRTPSTTDEAAAAYARQQQQPEKPQLSVVDTNKRTAAAQVARSQDKGAEEKRAQRKEQRHQEAQQEDAIVDGQPTNDVPAPIVSSSELGIGKVPKASSLAKWQEVCGAPVVDEKELLRDVIFILQGINGTFVRFEQVKQREAHSEGVIKSDSAATDAAAQEKEAAVKVVIVENETSRIPIPTRHLIHRLAETGKHYQRISAFVRTQATVENSGRVMQSLCHFIDEELTSYYELICDLESQLNQTLLSSDDNGGEDGGLTLRKINVLTQPALLRMRLMSSLVEGAQYTHGGSLVSLIHNYTFNGDPFIKTFTERLLEQVSRSFFNSLSRWIYEGELQDPFKEFFVELNPDPLASTSKEGKDSPDYPDEIDAAALWQNKFIFRSSLVPTFLGETFAKKIFSAGKSLNFIRYSCGDPDWKDTRGCLSENSQVDLRYADLGGLERTIDAVHSTVSKRLLNIFLDKFKLQKHLRAINDYLLLTNGDFSELLLESLNGILHKQASLLYRHSLTAALETAIRGSNAGSDDPDILRRLDARVLEFTGSETGWDTFTLEYRVDSPVNTVLDAGAMSDYQEIFLHLWKMKRVEMNLGDSFRKMLRSMNSLHRLRGRPKIFVSDLQKKSTQILGNLSEMIHFMRQLQGYNQLEAIEYSWSDLTTFFEKRCGDLDVLITAHKSYLSNLHGKIFLRGGKELLATELRSNFNTILQFTTFVDELSIYIVDHLSRQEFNLDQHQDEDVRFVNLIQRLEDTVIQFKDRTDHIISRLERHGNLVIRDLSVRLDYNGFYSRNRANRGAGRDGVGREPSSGR